MVLLTCFWVRLRVVAMRDIIFSIIKMVEQKLHKLTQIIHIDFDIIYVCLRSEYC
jgi:uncharacterized protein YaaR (DUF327 family)